MFLIFQGLFILGIASVYTFNRKLTIREVNSLILMMGLPIVACAVYLTLYVPDLRSVIMGTGSNAKTSGGFGPNQVSTVLGLGMFLFFARAVLSSGTRLLIIINLVTAAIIGYRGLVTFSRGGIITGVIMLAILFFFLYINSKNKGKVKLIFVIGLSLLFNFWRLAVYASSNQRYDRRYVIRMPEEEQKELILQVGEMRGNRN